MSRFAAAETWCADQASTPWTRQQKQAMCRHIGNSFQAEFSRDADARALLWKKRQVRSTPRATLDLDSSKGEGDSLAAS
jgi:hypothetical protein